MKNMVVTVIVTGWCLFSMVETASALAIGDKQWRQLTDTVNLSYNQLQSIYDVSTGRLKTGLATTEWWGIEFDGWIWASMDEVAGMIAEFTADLGGSSWEGGVDITGEDFDWTPGYIEAMGATYTKAYGQGANGMTRTLRQCQFDPGNECAVTVDVFDDVMAGGIDWLSVYQLDGWDYIPTVDVRGIFQYSLTPVPEPSTLFLLFGGLALLACTCRRRLGQ